MAFNFKKDDVANLDFVSDIAREDLEPIQSETAEKTEDFPSSVMASPKKSIK
jgi:hypothetical protein